MNKLIYASVVALICGSAIYLLYTNLPTNKSISDVKAEMYSLEEKELNSYSSTVDFTSTGTKGKESLVEIVISPEEIKTSSIGKTLGSETPFNSNFISDKEVNDSIATILGSDFDMTTLNETVTNYIFTMRNLEIVKGIPEKNSQVKKAVDDYIKSKESAPVETPAEETTAIEMPSASEQDGLPEIE